MTFDVKDHTRVPGSPYIYLENVGLDEFRKFTALLNGIAGYPDSMDDAGNYIGHRAKLDRNIGKVIYDLQKFSQDDEPFDLIFRFEIERDNGNVDKYSITGHKVGDGEVYITLNCIRVKDNKTDDKSEYSDRG